MLTSLALHLLCTCFALALHAHAHAHAPRGALVGGRAPPPLGFSFLCRYARRAPAAGDCWATLVPLCFSPSFSACLRRVHWCKKIRGLMMRAKNAPRLSRPNRSFLPRQGLTPTLETPDQRLLRKPLVALVAARQNQLLRLLLGRRPAGAARWAARRFPRSTCGWVPTAPLLSRRDVEGRARPDCQAISVQSGQAHLQSA